MLTPEGKRYIRRSLQYRLYLLGWRLSIVGFALAIPLFVVLDSAVPLPVARVCAVLAIAACVLTVFAMILTMITTVALGRPIRQVSRFVANHTITGMLLVDLFRAPLSPRGHRDDGEAPAQSGVPAPK